MIGLQLHENNFRASTVAMLNEIRSQYSVAQGNNINIVSLRNRIRVEPSNWKVPQL